MRGFSDLNPIAPEAMVDPSPEGAKAYLARTIRQVAALQGRSLEWWMLRRSERLVIDEMLGLSHTPPDNCLGSNLRIRATVGRRAIDYLSTMQAQRPERRFFLVTLISDRWLAPERDPTLWLGGMHATTRPIMAMAGFDGWLAMIEVQSLADYRRGIGRLLLPHVHAVGWTDTEAFNPEEAEARMAASERLTSHTGARTVRITRPAGLSASNFAAYVFKGAATAKYVVPDGDTASGVTLAHTALPPVMAVRQGELLSGVYFNELMFAGGDGIAMRAYLKSTMISQLRPRPQEISTEIALRSWGQARYRAKRRKHHDAVSIDRSTDQLPSYAPISLLGMGRSATFVDEQKGTKWGFAIFGREL